MAVSQRKSGDINPNDQVLILRSDRAGNDHLQYVWVLLCAARNPDGAICGQLYGANGSDFHIRKCPSCQSGAPGLSIEGLL